MTSQNLQPQNPRRKQLALKLRHCHPIYTKRRVPKLIPVLGSQPSDNVSHKPGGRLPLLSARPAVTPATLESCYQLHCLVKRGTMDVNSLPKTATRQRRSCDLNPIDKFIRLAKYTSDFYRAMLCIRGTSHGPVSVSDRLSQVGVLLKRLNGGSQKQHHTIPQRL